MELSQKLKELRKKQGLTQLELAERLFVSRQAISGWEAGTSRPSTENLQSLSRLFNIPLETLLDDTAEAEPAAAPEKLPAEEQAKDSFSMEAGETVRIRGIYSPEDASMDFGLIDSAGVFHYVNVKDGSIDQTFKISESGTYRLGIRNNSGKTVTVSGFVRY